ncbi:hypothetical protein CYLTODRAFT_416297 [Cylindrobasidium torrendii FP15055 ss-10]|uniref:GPI transamidase component PIG-S n=1 Tax=Cylindrobasidium torrendii FP15055 ss-10 TaxID=1314674 RepID=A0A0D7BV09_9AGAR|nr:hypothetical protein CYLTODRAFT_416297 [Cylindrobasidium torrendii FP15055 ss-10]
MGSLLDPSLLFFQQDRVRRTIIAAYWAVILLATPLWWNITSIERLPLPAGRVHTETQRALTLPATIQLEPGLVDSKPHIINELQSLLDKRLSNSITANVRVNDQNTSPGVYNLVFWDKEDAVLEGRTLKFPRGTSLTSLSDTIIKLLDPPPTSQDFRIAPYSSRYRLSFTLLNEDASSGSYISGWSVQAALRRYIQPILSRVSDLHNCTIESQIQFHAPLAFEPHKLEDNTTALTAEDLTIFVNTAEWTLSSSTSTDPVLHFALFVPNAERRPVKVIDSRTNTFLLPQWGGVVIYNPGDEQDHLGSDALDQIFPLFAQHLLTLLGVPSVPAGIKTPDALSDWQIDALLRRRAIETNQGARDILKSTVTLVNELENMPVGKVVQDEVQAALSALERLHSLSSKSLTDAARLSSEAYTLASRAFFNPDMLAMLYFPTEHKYAVYTPLFASAVIPLIAAAVRELLAWRKQKAAKAAAPVQ